MALSQLPTDSNIRPLTNKTELSTKIQAKSTERITALLSDFLQIGHLATKIHLKDKGTIFKKNFLDIYCCTKYYECCLLYSFSSFMDEVMNSDEKTQ